MFPCTRQWYPKIRTNFQLLTCFSANSEYPAHSITLIFFSSTSLNDATDPVCCSTIDLCELLTTPSLHQKNFGCRSFPSSRLKKITGPGGPSCDISDNKRRTNNRKPPCPT
eukprot:g8975.t1